eukprot:CAMPEP_0201984778 /NCGR_PEP_ID=MMETSP0904-20121228/84648_1 /ASSEMBLY_ACC=CAM_ASM_000553 /TAXON_ID=420261 /ORGANISM="Thalassiosira antarctica, Strain CCMP982" /LENGTH=40 /DNA_ID= /DNA_START= /DNA_END= /DNA_ORIENTATION=
MATIDQKSVRFTGVMIANAKSGGGSGANFDTTFKLNISLD